MKVSVLSWVPMVVALAPAVFAADTPQQDRYRNYAELSAHERLGKDYRIELTDRSAPVSVIAIHGGRIEAGSDDAAALVAGRDWNLYRFVATKAQHNRELHITSDHFDEPGAVALMRRSDRCVSMHGFALPSGELKACIGGGNTRLAQAVYDALKSRVPKIKLEYPCARFGGADPDNILNRCVHQGVQIEMSPALRDGLRSDAGLATQFAEAVRRAVR